MVAPVFTDEELEVLSIVAFHGAGRGHRLTGISNAFDRPR